MTTPNIDFYRQDLEIDIISRLAELKGLELSKATDIYYRSRLCNQIAEGLCGVDNLDYKYLASDLIENEPELFEV